MGRINGFPNSRPWKKVYRKAKHISIFHCHTHYTDTKSHFFTCLDRPQNNYTTAIAGCRQLNVMPSAKEKITAKMAVPYFPHWPSGCCPQINIERPNWDPMKYIGLLENKDVLLPPLLLLLTQGFHHVVSSGHIWRFFFSLLVLVVLRLLWHLFNCVPTCLSSYRSNW